MEINRILTLQRAWFKAGATLDTERRIAALKRLRAAIMSREQEISAALLEDLGKNATEAYMCETGMVLTEINHIIKRLRTWNAPQYKRTPLALFPASSFELPSPYGTVLIISPWNYPLTLTMMPLAAAVAAGNTVVVKPSAHSPTTTALIGDILNDVFPKEHVYVVQGDREENADLLNARFDYIFFTGSRDTGRTVMESAAKNLTPVTLELGGKSPCIVDESANLKVSAARIVFGKFINCGQTCVAPDYLLVQCSVKDELISLLKSEIEAQYGTEPLKNPSYGKIINQKQFDRVLALCRDGDIIHGGGCDPALLRIEPTILDNVSLSDPVMRQEIFGPVLPILTFEELWEVPELISKNPSPLALYHFTSNKTSREYIQKSISFGGGCVNDTIVHLASSHLGFGGVGQSGMGAYHGKKSFDTFTHYKSIVQRPTFIDPAMRYRPYTPVKAAMIKIFMK